MITQAKHYEIIADKLKSGSDDQLRAYRAAQNHLQAHDKNYMADLKRLQAKQSVEAWVRSERGRK